MKKIKGYCHICRSLTDVRYINIYHIGSEGLNICWNCEKELLIFLDERKRFFQIEYMRFFQKEHMKKKIEEKNLKMKF